MTSTKTETATLSPPVRWVQCGCHRSRKPGAVMVGRAPYRCAKCEKERKSEHPAS